jgi:outer membrane murein-binding lipoprotein Lpp
MGKDKLDEIFGAIKTLGVKMDSLEKMFETDRKVSEMKSKLTDDKIDQLSGKIDDVPTKMKVFFDTDIRNCRDIEKAAMEEVGKRITDHELRIKVFEITFGAKNATGYSPSSKQQGDPYR